MIKKVTIFAIVSFVLLMIFMLFMASSCVTIKNYPTAKTSDTVYIEKECSCFGWRGVDPGFYQWPSYPYELPKLDTGDLGIWIDTGYFRGKTLGSYYPDTTMITVDSSYKLKAIKAQQITNAKQ